MPKLALLHTLYAHSYAVFFLICAKMIVNAKLYCGGGYEKIAFQGCRNAANSYGIANHEVRIIGILVLWSTE